MDSHLKLEPAQREKLIRQRSVAKGMLSRMQNFIDSGNTDVHQIQVRCNKLPDILSKYEAAQEELECYDEADHTEDRAAFELQYYTVDAKFQELLCPTESRSSLGVPDNTSAQGSNASGSTPASNQYIKLPVIELPTFSGDHCKWLHFRDTFQTLIVDNASLSNVQKLHYLVSSLKDEPKQLLVNLPITHDNFAVAWKLVTDRYNNIRLIAMKHVSQLFQIPQARRGDATSLRQLVNHVTSHLNAIEALALNTSMHTLILNHMLLAELDPETHKSWEKTEIFRDMTE